jgi:hypothetical protein
MHFAGELEVDCVFIPLEEASHGWCDEWDDAWRSGALDEAIYVQVEEAEEAMPGFTEREKIGVKTREWWKNREEKTLLKQQTKIVSTEAICQNQLFKLLLD